jgi:uncharacterized hydrophobic protein (TIGR00271 family)
MNFLKNLKIRNKIKAKDRYKKLVEKSKLDFDFAFLSLAGLAIAVLGLSINSSPAVVGAMIIAPLIYSILVLPAAIVWQDKKVFLGSFWNLFIEILIGIIFCVILSYILGINVNEINLISDLQQSTIIYFAIALIAGSAATLSLFWPGASEQLTGVAVSVALVPPIAVMGIAIAGQSNDVLLLAAGNLFLNLTGIMLGSYIILKIIKKLD